MDHTQAEPACKSRRTWEPRAPVRGESRREQQFYKYYGPFRQMTDRGPTFCDVRDPQAREQHVAVSCPDKILTAFCQLGALRLKTRRAMMFFFDVNHAYILAEATQTISLEDDNTHDDGDELWMGHSVIPRDVACCEVTVNLPSFPATAAANGDDRDSIFLVNDLTKHPDLRDRPYVTGRPHARFYAGVPITTSSGVNIGAYCILDDKPRDVVSQQDLVFLRDMSQTVMTHLETVLALYERQQGSQMVAGLSAFVQSAPVSKHAAKPSSERPTRTADTFLGGSSLAFEIASPLVKQHIPDALVQPVGKSLPVTPAPATSISSREVYFDEKTVSLQKPGRSSPGSSETNEPALGLQRSFSSPDDTSDSLGKHVGLARESVPEPWKNRMSTDRPSVTRPPLLSGKANEDVGGVYQKAAEILCRCLRVDGAAFLDASVGVFGGLSEGETPEASNTTTNAGEHSGSAFSQLGSASTDMKVCTVLGSAQSARNEVTETDDVQPAKKLTESFLRDLLRRHPAGNIWTFDENGSSHSDDESSTDNDDLADTEACLSLQSPVTRRRKSTWKERRNDGTILQSMFPGARCIALHGIWDNIRHRWLVGGLFWTVDPFRVLSTANEMSFVAAFCNVIVAETRRLEAQGSDEAKSDFISTLSHELRSPLHGILGSSEILAGFQLDNAALTLVEQIDTCGHTLLEIIDHLLDFANLRKQRLEKGAAQSPKISHMEDLSPSAEEAALDLTALQTSVALDDLTEDAIISTAYSFGDRRGAEHRSQIPVILDIDRSANVESWHCRLATGAWRRICMNLVVNALKYTPFGFIHITLQQKTKTGDQLFDAVLSVDDSGKGMSKEFQKNHLFRDFSQEDTQSTGLGLGMHMVARMVHTMGGRIQVTSDQKGSGTRVTVSVPLEHSRNANPSGPNDSNGAPNKFSGTRVGIVAEKHRLTSTREEILKQSASAMSIAAIARNCQYLGAEVTQVHWENTKLYDITIILDAGLEIYFTSLRDTRNASAGGRFAWSPLVVVCTDNVTAQRFRDSWSDDDLSSDVVVEFVALPCSARQIARAITSALQQQRKSPSMDTQASPERRITAASTSLNLLPRSHASTLRMSSDVQRPDVPPIEPQLANTPMNRITPAMTLVRATVSMQDRPILLLVDDNDINLKLLVAYAARHGYPHVSAGNGRLAVDAYQKAHKDSNTHSKLNAGVEGASTAGMPTVILMDINMPVMDGYEAAQQIRSYERKHQLAPCRIIAVTALQSEAARVEAFGSGFNMFLSKPVKLKDLTSIIEAEQSRPG